MARAVKTSGDIASGALVLGVLFFLLIIPLIGSMGYIIYLIKTSWKFKLFKKYNINVTKIKLLKTISMFLIFFSIIFILILMGEKDKAASFDSNDSYHIFIASVSLIVSLIFLFFAMKITEYERESIKKIKDFNIEIEEMINAKKPILQQVVSMHTRDSDKYNMILKSEFNDIIDKIQNQFNFSSDIMNIIKEDVWQQLKEI